MNSSSGGHGWDQFETNERLYNVTSTYDENIYTKKLDKSTLTLEQQRQAERLAREIESQVSDNIHLREERGHALERDMDEEELYSGVRREKEDVWARGKSVTPGKQQSQRETRARSAEKSPVPLAPPPGLARPQAKELSEERKAEPVIETTPSTQPLASAEGSKEAELPASSQPDESSAKEASSTESKPRGLDPNAKPFTFNVKAPEFTPQIPPSIPSPAMGPAAGVPYGAFPPYPMQNYEYQAAYMQGPPMMYPGVPPPQYEAYPQYAPMPFNYAMNVPMGYPQAQYFQPMQGRGSSRPYNSGQGSKGYQR